MLSQQDIVETQLNRMLIEDFGPSEVKKFVSYLYSGKTPDFNPTPELLLLVAIPSFLVPFLRGLCVILVCQESISCKFIGVNFTLLNNFD